MKKAKKLLLQAASLIMAAVMFTGCYYPLTSKQKGWISQIEKYYPDDTFTYVGHSTVSMGVTSPSCISLESENFPHVDVQIYEVDGKLYSNYPLYYHKEAVTEYFSDLIISCFGCDYVELEMTDTADKPLKYVSDEKYIEKYAIHIRSGCTMVLHLFTTIKRNLMYSKDRWKILYKYAEHGDHLPEKPYMRCIL